MPSGRCTFEIFVGGHWMPAATLFVTESSAGTSSPSRLAYDFPYLDAMAGALSTRDARAVSCRYPLGYEDFLEPTWPAFLLDLMPAGAARRHWEARLGLPDAPRGDWPVLLGVAGNPPGNVRVAEAVEAAPDRFTHPGFARRDVVDRAEGFVEYARSAGAPVSGSTGAGGDSPKFLLREDMRGRWHADGALPDERTRRCWLVKFPRNRADASDRLVLRAEAGYHRVARRMGVRASGRVEWEQDCLFVERFDRVVRDKRVERLGLESLYSLAGVAEFGATTRKETLATALARFASDPPSELRELLLRDVLDVALGNTDNHGRNTSVLKDGRGRVALSPLYDFAPMILDRSGIARVSRWRDGSDYPEWSGVAETLGPLGLPPTETRRWLRSLAPKVRKLPATLRTCEVPPAVIEACEPRIRRVAESLAALPEE
ncbi:MAG: type II toxin-antitoxin system HipA family toxin [Polyangiaceae bacterium]